MTRNVENNLVDDEDGAILIETLIIMPVWIGILVSFMAYGNLLWQREQLQTGVRDAARYWSRCRESAGAFNTDCSETVARNIAFFGTPNPIPGSTRYRVPAWDGLPANELEITPVKGALPGSPDRSDTVTVVGRVETKILGVPFDISYSAEMRYIGW